MSKFGETLRELREQKKMSQEELGLAIGKTHVAVGDWERGKRNPKRDSVVKLAQVLGVPTSDLLLLAGFAPQSAEIEYVQDLSVVPAPEGYSELDPADREIALKAFEAMVEGLRQSRQQGTIGAKKEKSDIARVVTPEEALGLDKKREDGPHNPGRRNTPPHR